MKGLSITSAPLQQVLTHGNALKGPLHYRTQTACDLRSQAWTRGDDAGRDIRRLDGAGLISGRDLSTPSHMPGAYRSHV